MLKYVHHRLSLLKAGQTQNITRRVYPSLLYLEIVTDSAHAHLQSFIRTSISFLGIEPYSPDNSYSESIRNVVLTLYRLFSFVPCLMPITVAALAYRDPTALDLLTKYQAYRPTWFNHTWDCSSRISHTAWIYC